MPKTEKSTSSPVERKSLRAAAERFDIRRFRPGQMDVMEAVLSGKDALAVMPTGSGKSLTFQIPSLLLPKATVVVSPLISLMQDQVEKAEEAEIESAKLNSTLSAAEERQTRDAIAEGDSKLIYVSNRISIEVDGFEGVTAVWHQPRQPVQPVATEAPVTHSFLDAGAARKRRVPGRSP